MFFTGKYGIVLLPDESAALEAKRLGNLIPNNAIDLESSHPPHMTLYHTKVKNLPEFRVIELLAAIQEKLPVVGKFIKLAPFGRKFVFWDTERGAQLVSLHQKSLELSEFYDSEGEQQADSEALDLSEEEAKNVREYGHPLVKYLWRPHITVGYVPAGYHESSVEKEFLGMFTKVAFVKVGEYGTIAERVL